MTTPRPPRPNVTALEMPTCSSNVGASWVSRMWPQLWFCTLTTFEANWYMSINCSSLTSVRLLLKTTQLANCAAGAAPIIPRLLLPSAAISPATSVPCAQL